MRSRPGAAVCSQSRPHCGPATPTPSSSNPNNNASARSAPKPRRTVSSDSIAMTLPSRASARRRRSAFHNRTANTAGSSASSASAHGCANQCRSRENDSTRYTTAGTAVSDENISDNANKRRKVAPRQEQRASDLLFDPCRLVRQGSNNTSLALVLSRKR